MDSTLFGLLERLDRSAPSYANIISWGSPVAAFGNPASSTIATVGLNPSNREFVDEAGEELVGALRRFPTLRSLGLNRWSEARENHVSEIGDSYADYFLRNPYDRWFKRLDYVISGTATSFYKTGDSLFEEKPAGACHLDLIPYATTCKWTDLTHEERSDLLEFSGDTLGQVLQNSSIHTLVLNGQGVVDQFEKIAGISLEKEEVKDWVLPRRNGLGVKGYGYTGSVRKLFGLDLPREIFVLGYNHNLQSSFGVTLGVVESIKDWISIQVGNFSHEA